MKLHRITYFLFTLCLLACNKEKQPISVERSDYHAAMDVLTEVMIHDIFSPPVASRIYVYPNIAAYETLNSNPKNSTYHSLTGQLTNFEALHLVPNSSEVNYNLAALIAYLDVAKELVFSGEMILHYRDSLYTNWEKINKSEFEYSKDYGLEVSKQVIDWMQKDAYAETRTMQDYNIFNNTPSAWKPTPPAYMKGIEPNWNKLRPFTLDSASQFQPQAHPEFSMKLESLFYKELISVYNEVNRIREHGNESEEIAIARFWDCNPFVSVNKGHFMFAEKKITPGAHWVGICKIAANLTEADLRKTVFAHTKTSIAIADAFISCWDEKYRSNLVRPETLIVEFIDPDWTPILQTPPFPEYTSGHSVVSSAAAEVLTDIFGDKFTFLDNTELPYGLPVREFESFEHAASEAAISRMYGGIHYQSAVYEGKIQGVAIGKWVNNQLEFIKKNNHL
ncbi:vanadium-dependent haloperoxidase [Psychroflexus salis]|uniref:Phosphatidic acid phosphatase type 2/haloperoxidase domain-containing protein n=1 Tax=Psychroflexus salis TaxID=1526574 RepID=A0A917E5T1_9FLAO|nr:vanadium-dependent haloperoxidase [Psychroflexus salis]GGE07309.1 hypothetical protein GCM10010831_06030 [Psychroflexus salis]